MRKHDTSLFLSLVGDISVFQQLGVSGLTVSVYLLYHYGGITLSLQMFCSYIQGELHPDQQYLILCLIIVGFKVKLQRFI